MRFLDKVEELEEAFAHLAASEIIEDYLVRGIQVHDAIVGRSRPNSMAWLRTAFPRCLDRRPVLVAFRQEDRLCFQLYICAASDYMSSLDSEVVHLLAHEVHS